MFELAGLPSLRTQDGTPLQITAFGLEELSEQPAPQEAPAQDEAPTCP